MPHFCATSRRPFPHPTLCLAPMAGFTDAPMRWLSHRFGAECVYTEMVNARAVGVQAPASLRLLETLDGEGRTIAHLYGNVPDDFARAAEVVTAMDRFAGIDINCGCPAPKVTQGGAGAALMADPKRIGEIVKATVTHTSLPVSVKTRLGLRRGEDTVFDVAKNVADAGGAFIAVHGRYASQFHTGEVYYDTVARLVAMDILPVVGNGGITNVETARRMRETGVRGIMVGWAAVGNPWIFGKIGAQNKNGEMGNREKIPLANIREVLMEHLALSLRHKQQCEAKYPGSARPNPDEGVALDFRCHHFRYLNGIKGVSRLRAKLHRLTTLDTILAAVNEILAIEQEFRARIGRT